MLDEERRCVFLFMLGDLLKRPTTCSIKLSRQCAVTVTEPRLVQMSPTVRMTVSYSDRITLLPHSTNRTVDGSSDDTL